MKLELGKEYPPPDEQKHIDSLIEQLRAKMERDYLSGRVLRDAHPKMHGCVRGEFRVEPDLAEQFRVGIFRQSRSYPAWIRFSNQSGTVSDDAKGDIRGVALKLMKVEGEKLLPNETRGTTQDFIFISEDRFVTRDVAEFDGLVRALTAHQDAYRQRTLRPGLDQNARESVIFQRHNMRGVRFATARHHDQASAGAQRG